MGRSFTPPYRIEFRCPGRCHMTPIGLKGRQNQRALVQYVEDLLCSTEPGGVNEHLAPMQIIEATLIHQASGEVRGTWRPKC